MEKQLAIFSIAKITKITSLPQSTQNLDKYECENALSSDGGVDQSLPASWST